MEVKTAQELVTLFNETTGNTLQTDIEVTADLDFFGSTLTHPLGAFSNGTCVVFSGKFQGNGHSIKGLKMDNQYNYGGYRSAGVFCRLKDAIVENFVIDSSCSFTSYDYAGALSVSLDGSLTVKNVTNRAVVINSGNRAGGFIGYIEDLKQPVVISFGHCVNDGNVMGGYHVGGFVGFIGYNTNVTLAIINSTNNGKVAGYDIAGGFVGGFSYSFAITSFCQLPSSMLSTTLPFWGSRGLPRYRLWPVAVEGM